MRTAISVPDDTFALATRRAAQMGISRSAFFAAAAVHYLDELDRASLIERFDSAVSMVGTTVPHRTPWHSGTVSQLRTGNRTGTSLWAGRGQPGSRG